MKIAIVGGHMAPALGLINAFPQSVEIVYIGRSHVFEGDAGDSLEQKTLSEKDIRFIPLQSGRVQRVLTKQTIPSLMRIPQGFVQALAILRKEKPDVVVGFGGYLSVPIGIAARVLGIPLVIHESTLAAGLANKILTPFANKICISWETSRAYFPKEKTILTGNPLLPFDKKGKHLPLPESKENMPLLVITGGSGGSHIVNGIVMQILPELLAISRVLHLTGDAKEYKDYDKLTKLKKKLPEMLRNRYSVVKFVHPKDINSIFSQADLVIGRSGINTVATLLILHKKAILIPLLVGQKNEQLKNAKLMESEGLATVIDQRVVSPKVLFKAIQENLNENNKKIVKWHIPVIENGAENLQKEVFECVKSSHKEN